MGSWSASITGNDTAQDLKPDYQAAFFYNDVPTAVAKIDSYVREYICNESDEEEWCNYFYSLADYMWKKGILTEEIKKRAVEMIDSGFGLGLWADAGEKTLAARQKVLAKFREQLLSPLPPKKKIKVDVHCDPIFERGDIVVFQLQTAGKEYTKAAQNIKIVTQEEFHALDGKYIAVHKVNDHISWTSKIEPRVRSLWAQFRLFDKIFDTIPTMEEVLACKYALLHNSHIIKPIFLCDSSMFYFKRRKYRVIGNSTDDLEKYDNESYKHIFLGINKEWYNPDADFISHIGKETVFCEYDGDIKDLSELYFHAWEWTLPVKIRVTDENKPMIEERKIAIYDSLDSEHSAGYRFYCMKYGGVVIGFFTLNDNRIESFAVSWRFMNFDFGTKMTEYAVSVIDKNGGIPEIYIPDDISRGREYMLKICRKFPQIRIINEI